MHVMRPPMMATAWVLDVSHRAHRFSCEVPAGQRALTAVRAWARRDLGLELATPLGVRGLDGAAELIFLDPGAHPAWPALRDWAADDDGFSLYVEALLGGWSPPTRELDVFHFGDTPALAARLGHLVVKGVKRGTTGWLAAAERDGSPVPTPGQLSIVTDGFGIPLCAVRSERVQRLRFGAIAASHAWAEGEGDRTLEDWREAHLAYFHREAAALGLTFTEDAEVFFEHFRVVAVLGRPDA